MYWNTMLRLIKFIIDVFPFQSLDQNTIQKDVIFLPQNHYDTCSVGRNWTSPIWMRKQSLIAQINNWGNNTILAY